MKPVLWRLFARREDCPEWAQEIEDPPFANYPRSARLSGFADVAKAGDQMAIDQHLFREHGPGANPEGVVTIVSSVDDDFFVGFGVCGDAQHDVVAILVMTVSSRHNDRLGMRHEGSPVVRYNGISGINCGGWSRERYLSATHGVERGLVRASPGVGRRFRAFVIPGTDQICWILMQLH